MAIDYNVIQQLIINQLKDLDFFVPSYQRGYRWTESEVEDLLNDIWEFDYSKEAKYCLQPLIVQKREDGKWEVVDGQQRLTTIFIIMKAIQHFLPEEKPNFSLEYKTRPNSSTFLKGIEKSSEGKNNNIDYYYMYRAFQTVTVWRTKMVEASDNKKTESSIMSQLNNKLRETTFFIWYPLEQNADPIDMFSKVNVGKIPLTDGELIKALLLNPNNFDTNETVRRQTEISVSWDRIEQDLNHDSLWYFFNEFEKEKIIETRIDIIFDLLANEYNKELNINKETPHFPFVVISQVLNNGKKAIDIWKDVELQYEKLKSWYEDYNLYHLIGFLFSTDKNSKNNKKENSLNKAAQIKELTYKKGKKQVLKDLVNEIKEQLNITIIEDKVEIKKIDLYQLDYENDGKEIRRILLLFNIASLICCGDGQLRFSFELYKKEKWDIEHIHATNDDTADPDNNIENLTLLPRGINRAFKDKPFNEKRQFIIKCEKEGAFIPLCSKNVFLKYYSDKTDDSQQNEKDKNDDSLWNDKDKEEYIKNMQKALNDFFKAEWINNADKKSGVKKNDR